MGRRAHKPTDSQRSDVMLMAKHGVGHQYIADDIGIALKTLYKAYRPELDKGKAEGIGNATRKLRGIIDNDQHRGQLGAICFFLKCQGGWREGSIVAIEDHRAAKASETEDEASDLDAARAYKALMELPTA